MRHSREIARIAFPAIVSNITTPLLGLVDTAITGHLGAAAYIAAIALGSTLFSTMYMLFGFLRMGTSGLTAQAYGAGDAIAQSATLRRALFVALAAGTLICGLSPLLGPTLIGLMDGSHDPFTRELALRYFRVAIWGAPAVLATFAFTGWFIGMQNSRVPMVIALATNVVNLLVSIGLVYGAGWNVEGVATGTLAAQYCGAILGLVAVLRHFKPCAVKLSIVLSGSGMKSFFKLHADIFLRTLCLVGVTLWFTHAGSLAGTDILAANALLLQLFLLFSYFMDGFAFAGEALAGKYWGARDGGRQKSLLRELMLIGVVCALIFAVVYAAAGDVILGLLSNRPEVLELARRYLPWAVALPLCGFSAFVLDGVFIGLTFTRGMLLALAIATAVFFGVWAVASPRLVNHGLWLAFDAYLLTRGAAQFIILRANKKFFGTS